MQVKFVILGLSLLAWASMMSWLVQRELIPYWEIREGPTYRSSWPKEVPFYVRKRVYLGHRPVGEAETAYLSRPDREEGVMATHFRLRADEVLRELGFGEAMAGRIDSVNLLAKLQVDAAYRLCRCAIEGEILWPIRVLAVPQGDQMSIEYKIAGESGTRIVPYDSSMLMNFLGGIAGFGPPTPASQWRLQTLEFDLLGRSLRRSTLYARVEEEKETVLLEGRIVEAMRVDFRTGPEKKLPLKSCWVDERGRVLVEELPLLKCLLKIVLVEERGLTIPEVAEWRKRLP